MATANRRPTHRVGIVREESKMPRKAHAKLKHDSRQISDNPTISSVSYYRNFVLP